MAAQPIPYHVAPGEIEPDEPVKMFQCAVCALTGREEYPDADTYEDRAGNTLADAGFAPTGDWVCSRPCLSQLMFEKATPRQQDALKRYAIALQSMDELGHEIGPLMMSWGQTILSQRIHIDIAMVSLGAFPIGRFHQDKWPKWMRENVAPEDRMRDAIGEALHVLDSRAMYALLGIVLYLKNLAQAAPGKGIGVDFIAREAGRALGSLYDVIAKLKAAVAGGEA